MLDEDKSKELLIQELKVMRQSMLQMSRWITISKQIEVEREQLLTTEREQRLLAETLSRIGLALNSTQNLPELLNLICQESITLFRVEAAFIWLVQDNELVGFAGHGPGSDEFTTQRAPLTDPVRLGARVIREKQPIFINDVLNSDQINRQLFDVFQIKAILGMPLIIETEPIGALMIFDKQHPHRFGPDDLKTALILSNYAAIAIENGRLYEQAQQEITERKQAEEALQKAHDELEQRVKERTVELVSTNERLLAIAVERQRLFEEEQHQRQMAESLQEVVLVLNSSLDQETVLGKILEQLRRVIDYDGASILLPEDDDLVIRSGIHPDSAIGFHFPLSSNNPVVRVFTQQQPLVIADVLTDPDWQQLIYPIRSWMGVPLFTNQKVSGVLSVDSFGVGTYSQSDTHIVQIFANHAAIAIENARLFKELEVANTSLKASNAELDAFAHTAAHDLKNPLALIIGYSDYLIDDLAEMERNEAIELLQKVKSIGQKMSSIIDELLLLASVRQDQMEVEPLNMANIVAQAQQRLTFIIEEYQGQIILPDTWPIALGYAPWIEEVWANYLSNGLKYGGQPPQLELGATPQADGMICFWVRDDGPGISAESQTKLFTEFTRLDETRAKGHGLGLSIVKRIVARLGGQAGVTSEGVTGRGSTFYFTLPGEET